MEIKARSVKRWLVLIIGPLLFASSLMFAYSWLASGDIGFALWHLLVALVLSAAWDEARVRVSSKGPKIYVSR